MIFYNREEEKKLIAEELKKKKTFTVVYGRRRIGKTRLIQEVLKNIKHAEFFVPRTCLKPHWLV